MAEQDKQVGKSPGPRRVPSLGEILFPQGGGMGAAAGAGAPAEDPYNAASSAFWQGLGLDQIPGYAARALGWPYIQKGYELGGVPGALGGFGRAMAEGTQQLNQRVLVDPAMATLEALRSGFRGGPPEAQTQAPAPEPAPAAPPGVLAGLLAGGGIGAGGGGFGPNLVHAGTVGQVPFQHYTAPQGQFPQMPDLGAYRQAVAGAQPQAPTPATQREQVMSVLQGLGAGALSVGQNPSLGAVLLGAGTGALTGGQAERAKAEADQRLYQQQQQLYQQYLAQQEQQQAEAEYQHQVDALNFSLKLQEAQQQAEEQNRKQLMPQAMGSYLVVPKQGKDGQTLSYELMAPAMRGGAGSGAGLSARLLGAEMDTDLMYKTLMSVAPPEMLDKIANDAGTTGMTLRGMGMSQQDASNAGKEQLLKFVRDNYPTAYGEVVNQAQQRALFRALAGK